MTAARIIGAVALLFCAAAGLAWLLTHAACRPSDINTINGRALCGRADNTNVNFHGEKR
jgi:hypothetical protein